MDSTEGPDRSTSRPRVGNDEKLRALAVRLALHSFALEQSTKDVQLLVGELPAEPQFSVPIPEGSEVLGSLIAPQQGITVIFQTELSPDDVIDFYREQLTSQGWSEPQAGGQAHGFVSSPPNLGHRVTLCRSPRGPALIAMASGAEGQPTDVRLNLLSIQGPFRHMCRPRRPGTGPMDDILPGLLPPPNARLEPGGGGGSPDRMYSDAELVGELDLVALAEHYNPQIERAGWRMQDAGQSGPLIWSTWIFNREDEPWRGIFYVLRRPDLPEHFAMHIQAEAAIEDDERRPRPAGWTTVRSRIP